MKGFFNWSYRYTRNKIYKVILFTLILLCIYLFKSFNVFAATNISGNLQATYVTKKCIEDNNMLYCSNYNNYVLQATLNTSSSSNSKKDLYFDTSNFGIGITSYIREYTFSNEITMSSSVKNILVNLRSQLSDGLNCDYITTNWNFPSYINSIDKIYPSMYKISNFKPYYAEYYDNENSIWVKSNLKFTYDNSCNRRFIFYDIPTNTKVSKVRLYFGGGGNYSGTTKVINTFNVPNYNNWNYLPNDSTNAVVKISVNDYLSTPNDNTFLFYIPKNVNNFYTNVNKINVVSISSSIADLQYDNTNYDNITNIFDFTNSNLQEDEEIQQIIDNINTQTTITSSAINNSLGNGTLPNSSDSNFIIDGYNTYLNNTYASSYSTFLTSIFSTPLSKIQTQLNTDLTTNNSLSQALCNRNSSFDIGGQSHLPTIKLWGDYQFQLPCLHTDIYPQLVKGQYGFYGQSFNGVSLGASHSNVQYSFVLIYQTILRGFLVYLLYVNVLNVIKYVLDPNDTKVEVLEL